MYKFNKNKFPVIDKQVNIARVSSHFKNSHGRPYLFGEGNEVWAGGSGKKDGGGKIWGWYVK